MRIDSRVYLRYLLRRLLHCDGDGKSTLVAQHAQYDQVRLVLRGSLRMTRVDPERVTRHSVITAANGGHCSLFQQHACGRFTGELAFFERGRVLELDQLLAKCGLNGAGAHVGMGHTPRTALPWKHLLAEARSPQ